jgi:hypothetical protein
MKEILAVIAIFVIWVLLQKVILPRFGIST